MRSYSVFFYSYSLLFLCFLSQSLMVRDVVRDYLEKDPADRTESDIRKFASFEVRSHITQYGEQGFSQLTQMKDDYY